jgi:hypothetical protein
MPRDGEQFLEEYGMYVSGYEQSDYGIEWMRFEPDSPLPELVKTVPHVAFERVSPWHSSWRTAPRSSSCSKRPDGALHTAAAVLSCGGSQIPSIPVEVG